MKKRSLKKSALNSGKNLYKALPLIIAIIGLISILSQILTKEFYAKIFQESFIDPLIGSIIGSISVGGPVISYIIGGEMLKQGASRIAVTAFIVSWISVGIATLPLESKYLGKKFAIIRNSLSFIFSIIVAIVTTYIFNLI